jgi:tetratricopeptide (TPR) repeat protein
MAKAPMPPVSDAISESRLEELLEKHGASLRQEIASHRELTQEHLKTFEEKLAGQERLTHSELEGVQAAALQKLDGVTLLVTENTKILEAKIDGNRSQRAQIFTVAGLVVSILGGLGAWKVFDSSSRIERIESVKQAVDQTRLRLQQTNHALADYLISRLVQDFEDIQAKMSPNMPDEDISWARTLLNNNLELIGNLKSAYGHLSVANNGQPAVAPAGDDDPRLIREFKKILLLHEAYLAITPAVTAVGTNYDRRDAEFRERLNEAEQAWRKLIVDKTPESVDECEQYIPHLKAYGLNVLGTVVLRRNMAFPNGIEPIMEAQRLFAEASSRYTEFAKAYSNEGVAYNFVFLLALEDAKKNKRLGDQKDELLERSRQAIAATNKGLSVATQDRSICIIENNLACDYYERALLQQELGRTHEASDEIVQAEKFVTDALVHANPAASVFITAAEVKGARISLDHKWREQPDFTDDKQWDAIMQMIRSAKKKGWKHPADCEETLKKCPGLRGLEFLKPKRWEQEADGTNSQKWKLELTGVLSEQ